MYAPITSEIIIKRGMVLKKISTEQLFEVAERLEDGAPVSGEDRWEIAPIGAGDFDRAPLVLGRQELSEKYFAEVDE